MTKYKKMIIGLTLVMSITTIGCTQKMSDTEMIVCKTYEDKLEDNLFVLNSFVNEMVDNSQNVSGYNTILSNKEWINKYDEKINNVSLDDLELYHKNLKKYKNVKDDDLENIKYLYFLCQRKLSYSKEIIELCEDKEISSEDLLKIQKLGILSGIVANANDSDTFANSEKLIKLQKEMDDKYGMDSAELYLLQEIINE